MSNSISGIQSKLERRESELAEKERQLEKQAAQVRLFESISYVDNLEKLRLEFNRCY